MRKRRTRITTQIWLHTQLLPTRRRTLTISPRMSNFQTTACVLSYTKPQCGFKTSDCWNNLGQSLLVSLRKLQSLDDVYITAIVLISADSLLHFSYDGISALVLDHTCLALPYDTTGALAMWPHTEQCKMDSFVLFNFFYVILSWLVSLLLDSIYRNIIHLSVYLITLSLFKINKYCPCLSSPGCSWATL